MKRCSKCKFFKKEASFGKDKSRKDGLCHSCKCCQKKCRENKKDKKKEYDENYRKKNLKTIREKKKKYNQTKKGRSNSQKRAEKWKKRNPEKVKVRNKLSNEIRNGRILKPKTCSICHKESEIIHGHHEDYAKPLKVIWCCPQCHSNIHMKKKEKND